MLTWFITCKSTVADCPPSFLCAVFLKFAPQSWSICVLHIYWIAQVQWVHETKQHGKCICSVIKFMKHFHTFSYCSNICQATRGLCMLSLYGRDWQRLSGSISISGSIFNILKEHKHSNATYTPFIVYPARNLPLFRTTLNTVWREVVSQFSFFSTVHFW